MKDDLMYNLHGKKRQVMYKVIQQLHIPLPKIGDRIKSDSRREVSTICTSSVYAADDDEEYTITRELGQGKTEKMKKKMWWMIVRLNLNLYSSILYIASQPILKNERKKRWSTTFEYYDEHEHRIYTLDTHRFNSPTFLNPV